MPNSQKVGKSTKFKLLSNSGCAQQFTRTISTNNRSRMIEGNKIMQKLINGLQAFKNEGFKKYDKLFETLADGQNPLICSYRKIRDSLIYF